MSDDYLHVLPNDPTFLPTIATGRELLAAVNALAPRADEVRVRHSGRMAFVDAGENFSSIHCPLCRTKLTMDWFGDAMDVVEAVGFDPLEIVTPCCGRSVSLNDLDYDWPQGFARWYVEAMHPDRGALTTAESARLADTLGTPIRIVWTHY